MNMTQDDEWIAERLPKDTSVLILDIGAGKSLNYSDAHDLVKYVVEKGYYVEGIDIKDVTYNHPNFKFVRGDFLKNNFDNRAFDLVISTQTWHHVGMKYQNAVPREFRQKPNPNGHIIFVDEIHRVLKENGEAFISTVIEPSKHRADSRRFTKDSIKELLKDKFIITEESEYTEGSYFIYCMRWKKI